MTTNNSHTHCALQRYKLFVNNVQVEEFSTFLLAAKAYLQYPPNSGYILDALPERELV